MALHESIRQAVGQFGKQVVGTATQLRNVLLDRHALGNAAMRMVVDLMGRKGVAQRLLDLDGKPPAQRQLQLKAIEAELVGSGLQRQWVRYVLDCYCYGLSWTQHAPQCPVSPSELNSQPHVLQQDRDIAVEGINIHMIHVQGGSFALGGTPEQGLYAAFDEKPSVRVQLSDYWLCSVPVTQRLWQCVTGSNPSHFTGDVLRPVERVTWNECQQFVWQLRQRTGVPFSLPTEAQWEFAARGGNLSRHCQFAGCSLSDLSRYAWYAPNAGGTTHAVGQKRPNELGLLDMSGNVGEWCADWYFNAYAASEASNPTGPAQGLLKVCRGGSYNDKAVVCRVSNRNRMNPDYRNKQVGLRLAISND